VGSVDAGVSAPGPGARRGPPSARAIALGESVRHAIADGARLAARGAGTWWPESAAGAQPLDLSDLTEVSDLQPADLVVTVGAGCRLDALAARLAAAGVRLALDPPGSPSRTVGGVLAAGAGGPLAARYGLPRDQVLGLTVVAGNGVAVRLGGRVVKNVAGFDVAKAVVGSHGACGVIVEAHLRLHARPQADETRAWRGSRQAVAAAAARVLAAGAAPAALEALAPPLAHALLASDGWALLVRDQGGRAAVEAELAAVSRAVGHAPAPVQDVADRPPWDDWRGSVGSWPVLVRVGADPAAWDAATALLEEHLGAPLGASVTVPRGTVRAGYAGGAAGAIRELRAAAARRGWPVTLERAGAGLRAEVGVFGGLEAGTQRLAEAVRRILDPNAVFTVPLLG
jgi:glycolate oxidase FAD binding subunit